MRRRFAWFRFIGSLLFLVLASSLRVPSVEAATVKTNGLQISPIRSEATVNPGQMKQNNLVVANLTKQPLVVDMYIEEFSVINQNYDFSFQAVQHDWIRLGLTELTLQPQESRTIPYTISPPADTTPGGYYFTLLASSNIKSGGIDSTIQAASLLYTTVNGNLDRSTKLTGISIPRVFISPDVTYSFDAEDTGNTYYTIYSIARMSNIFETTSSTQAAHTLMPQAPRHLTGSLPSPKLPGIYTATIGYKTDSGNIMTKNETVIYIPLWSIVVAIGVLYVVVHSIRIARRRLKFKKSE